MWPDNETRLDLFGFKVHADLIRNVVTNPSMLPTTIGVFGDWGGGKTSIMKMLEHDLDPASWPQGSAERTRYESVAVVYANTWLFEGYDDAKAALLASVLLALSEHTRFGTKVKTKVVSLLKSVNWMRFAGLTMKHVAVPAAAAFFTGGAAAVPAALAVSAGLSRLQGGGNGDKGNEEGSSDNEQVDLEGLLKEEDGATDVRTFRERFKAMLRDAGISTLVVLVDDLDRCTPDRIIENLEAVKLFLSADQTAFVIGADRRIVEHAIREKYAQRAADDDKDQRDKLVRDYLEKLVQVPYSLPRLSASEIHTYMTLLFCQRYLKEPQFDACVAACNAERTKNRYGAFGYAAVKAVLKVNDLEEKLGASLALATAAAPLIADGLKGNPRQVKRFLNALLLRKELAEVARLSNIQDAVLVKLMILEYTDDKAFGQLFSWQAQQDGHPAQLAALEAAATGTSDAGAEEVASKLDARWLTTANRRWLAMEPMLKGVDLRDYFWVARDRLESTFTGISMVPPAVRVVLDGLFAGSTPKRNAAMEGAKKLAPDERVALLNTIDQRLIRQPDDQTAYNALQYLGEAGLAEAVELLANVLLNRPLDKVPGAVGMQLMTLMSSHQKYQGVLEPVRQHLSNSKSAVGKAAQLAKPAKK